jgi:hypothetical protein
MRIIGTSSGREITLDGDLLAVMETLFHGVTRARVGAVMRNMNREIVRLVAQMTSERRSYLVEPVAQPGQLRKRQTRQLHEKGEKRAWRICDLEGELVIDRLIYNLVIRMSDL